MADKYIQVQSFKLGLDKRRGEMAAQPGALVTLENAFINPGGEIEKRKAFTLFANVAILDGDSNQGTFGLEATANGITVFGSALAYGTTPTQSQPVLASAMPTGVTYQQLKHPYVSSGGTYNKNVHRMTAVISSNFNGSAVAAATFTDGNTFLYYNGSLVLPSRNGRVVAKGYSGTATPPTGSDLATELAAEVNALGWSGAATGSYVDVKSPSGETFTLTPTWTDTTNNMYVQTMTGPGAGTVGAGASAAFQVSGVVSGATISIVAYSSETLYTSGSLATDSSGAVTAAAIVAAINATVYSPRQYTAQLIGTNIVVVTGPSGDTAVNTQNLAITTTGTITVGVGLLASATPTSVTGQIQGHGGFGGYFGYTDEVKAVAQNPTGTPTFSWSRVSGSSTISAASPTSATTYFQLSSSSNVSVSAIFKCTVTDGTSVDSNYVTVTFSPTGF